jgi:hypothetical protein
MLLAEASAIDDLFSGYCPLVLKAMLVLIIFLVVPLAVGYMEHKVLATCRRAWAPWRLARSTGGPS